MENFQHMLCLERSTDGWPGPYSSAVCVPCTSVLDTGLGGEVAEMLALEERCLLLLSSLSLDSPPFTSQSGRRQPPVVASSQAASEAR